MSRYAKNTDLNQKEVVSILKERDFQIFDASHFGEGFPDLIVAKNKEWWPVEIKNGDKATFSPAQAKFYMNWKGPEIKIITSKIEAMRFPDI